MEASQSTRAVTNVHSLFEIYSSSCTLQQSTQLGVMACDGSFSFVNNSLAATKPAILHMQLLWQIAGSKFLCGFKGVNWIRGFQHEGKQPDTWTPFRTLVCEGCGEDGCHWCVNSIEFYLVEYIQWQKPICLRPFRFRDWGWKDLSCLSSEDPLSAKKVKPFRRATTSKRACCQCCNCCGVLENNTKTHSTKAEPSSETSRN